MTMPIVDPGEREQPRATSSARKTGAEWRVGCGGGAAGVRVIVTARRVDGVVQPSPRGRFAAAVEAPNAPVAAVLDSPGALRQYRTAWLAPAAGLTNDLDTPCQLHPRV
jgi:hypothetical protein